MAPNNSHSARAHLAWTLTSALPLHQTPQSPLFSAVDAVECSLLCDVDTAKAYAVLHLRSLAMTSAAESKSLRQRVTAYLSASWNATPGLAASSSSTLPSSDMTNAPEYGSTRFDSTSPEPDCQLGEDFVDAPDSPSPQSQDVNDSRPSEAEAKPLPKRKRPPRKYTAEQRLHKQQHDVEYGKRKRKVYTEAKHGILYQLSPRPADASSWQEELVKRGEAESRAEVARQQGEVPRDWVSKDSVRPWKPLPVIAKVAQDDTPTAGPSRLAVPSSLPNPLATPTETVMYKLPFARDFQTAPVLGENSESNVTVQASDGTTVLQRFGPTNVLKARQLVKATEAGGAVQKALFAAGSASERCGGRVLELGQWDQHQTERGWTPDHLSRPAEADNALRWAWCYFHEYIAPLNPLLSPDFRIALEVEREASLLSMKALLGEEQCSLLCKWWHMATFTQGFTPGEGCDRSSKEPSIFTGFEEPCVLCVAHPEGFFKTIVQPSQFVIFRASLPYQVHPLPDAPKDAALRHWSICLSVRADTAFPTHGVNMTVRRHENPPRPTDEQRKMYKRPRKAKFG